MIGVKRCLSPCIGMLIAAGLFSVASMFPAHADDFYAGRQIKLVMGVSAGGGNDLYGRFLARYLAQYIPGRPVILIVNMPGAESLTAANYMATIAPRDGTEILGIVQALPMVQAMGHNNIRFDLATFNWLGNMSESANVFVSWYLSPVKTIEDAKRLPLTVGSTTPGSLSGFMPQMLNTLIGTKFRVVNGYQSGSAIHLAMERGEVDGRGSVTWASLKGEKPDWVRDGKFNVLVQVGLVPDADLPKVPMLGDLVTSPSDRAVAEFLSNLSAVSRAYALGPDIPPERLAILRHAFDEAMADPDAIAEAKRVQLDISPTSGEQLQGIVTSMVHAPPNVIGLLKASLKSE